MLRFFYVCLATVMVAISALSPALAQSDPLTVFAAASLKDVLEAVGQSYTASGGPEVRFSFAASSVLAKQIEAGAPADVFASADPHWMDFLIDKKLIQPETRVNLLGNALVVIAPATSGLETLPLTPEAFLKALGDGKLATGEVSSVPIGIYAKAAAQNLGLWEVIEPHLAQTDNVRGALVFVARGEAPLGIVYATDAKVERKVKIVATFPETSHDPIIYPFAVTRAAKGDRAQRFLDYLTSPAARRIFEAAGFPVL